MRLLKILFVLHFSYIFLINLSFFQFDNFQQNPQLLNKFGLFIHSNIPKKIYSKYFYLYPNFFGSDRCYQYFSPNINREDSEFDFFDQNNNKILILNSFEGKTKLVTFSYFLSHAIYTKNKKFIENSLKSISNKIFNDNPSIQTIKIYSNIRYFQGNNKTKSKSLLYTIKKNN